MGELGGRTEAKRGASVGVKYIEIFFFFLNAPSLLHLFFYFCCCVRFCLGKYLKGDMIYGVWVCLVITRTLFELHTWLSLSETRRSHRTVELAAAPLSQDIWGRFSFSISTKKTMQALSSRDLNRTLRLLLFTKDRSTPPPGSILHTRVLPVSVTSASDYGDGVLW